MTKQFLVRLGTVALVLLGSISSTAEAVQLGVNQAPFQSQGAKVVDNRSLPASYKPGVNKVTFQSEGVKMVGNLYLPASYKPGDKLPAVVITGSWITVKEQMAGLYARRLADQGFATLAFDFRFFGESGGQPRQYESPEHKIQDIKNAVTFLRSLPITDPNRVGGLGVCASAGYMAHAIAEGAGIKSFAMVKAWLQQLALE